MRLENQLIMIIGMTQNNWELTKEMVENSLETFHLRPIVWNKKQEFKDYTGDYIEDYFKNCATIGCLGGCEDIKIIGNEVYSTMVIKDEYLDLWKGKFDNWCIEINDDKKSFRLDSIEVF